MPTNFESYHPTDLPDEDTNGQHILEFFVDDPALGFRQSELVETLDMAQGIAGPTLRRLEQRGFVRHNAALAWL